MLRSGILNPQLNALLARVRHTNTLVIADKGFPFWPGVETIDLALVDDIPRVPQVLQAVLANWQCGRIWMASEFRSSNPSRIIEALASLTADVPITWEPHAEFKLHVPAAIGLIRTADSTPYANMILESA